MITFKSSIKILLYIFLHKYWAIFIYSSDPKNLSMSKGFIIWEMHFQDEEEDLKEQSQSYEESSRAAEDMLVEFKHEEK